MSAPAICFATILMRTSFLIVCCKYSMSGKTTCNAIPYRQGENPYARDIMIQI